MRSVIVAGLLIAVAGCAYPVKTAHVPDPTYAQTHTTPAPPCTPDHGYGRSTYEFCMYAVAQSKCLDLAEPSRQSCLASLKDPSPPTPEEIREAASIAATSRINRLDVQSMEREMNRESADIESSMRQVDQEQKMKDLENRMNDQMRRLEQEQYWDHLRAIDHDD